MTTNESAEQPRLSPEIRDFVLKIGIFLATVFIYSQYFGHLVFNDSSIFVNSNAIATPVSVEGAYLRIQIPGFEGSLLKFIAVHSAPFVIGPLFIQSWRFRYSLFMSVGGWSAVFIYAAVFRAKEFARLNPDGLQCFITFVSTYPLMFVCLLIGSVVGTVLAALKGPRDGNRFA